MIADGTPVFGLTGWAGTFAALDIAAIGCICLMAIVAVMEERKIRREKKPAVDSGINVTGDFARHDAGLFLLFREFQRSEGKLLAIKQPLTG